MIQTVLETIQRENLLQAGEMAVAGVSGGADSVCLLSVLLELSEALGIRVGAVHINHGIRGREAERDEEFVRGFCRERGVPLLVYRRDVPAMAAEKKLSLEEAGRIVRRQCFSRALEEFSAGTAAAAHNQNDNAETFLFRLFRGSGLSGLSGMEAKIDLPDGGKLVRPLLHVSRKEIEAYLAEKGISFCQDSTNREESYSRNRIRLRILPQAEQINEQAVSHIVQAAAMIGQLEREQEERAASWIRDHCVREGNFAQIPCRELGEMGRVQAGLVIRKTAEELSGSLKDLSLVHTESVLGLLEKQPGRRVQLPAGLLAVRESGGIWLGYPETEAGEEEILLDPREEEQEAQLFGMGFSYRLLPAAPGQKIPENRYTKWFDYDRIKDRLSLRGRRPGDWFSAFRDGRRQTVKAYMINEKIPARERGRIPLLADGSHVLWIVGGRISEDYKVTSDTRRILEIKFKRGEAGYGK